MEYRHVYGVVAGSSDTGTTIEIVDEHGDSGVIVRLPRGSGATLFITAQESVVVFGHRDVVRMRLAGGRTDLRAGGLEPLPITASSDQPIVNVAQPVTTVPMRSLRKSLPPSLTHAHMCE